jgi:stalled ribosome alternative rescue factor ArfA
LKSLDIFLVAFFSKKYYINIMKTAVKNIFARELSERKYRPRVIRACKGKGSYDRKRLEKRHA